MRTRNVFGLVLSVMLLLLTAGSSVARGPQPTGPSEAAAVNASPGANAPWFNIEVDIPPDTGQYTSVAIDPVNNTTYVSYYDATSQALRMAVDVGSGGNCGPNNSWLCETWDSGADVGKYSSTAVNPQSGAVGLAYHDALNGTLKYRTSSYVAVVDKGTSLESRGRYTSLKYFWNGTPIIAYHVNNLTGVDSLKVAYRKWDFSGNCGYVLDNVTGEWQCDTIQTGEGVGQYASLALDGGGFVHIAYYDGDNGDLWYATDRGFTKNCGPGGNTWFCYPVSGGTTDVGQYASLYVDSANRFHIAYYDATSDELKYAVDVGGGGNCGLLGSAQCDTIDDMPQGYHPLGVSMAEDPAGYPIIAYQEEFDGLNVARPVAALGLYGGGGNCGPAQIFSTWYCETIDPSGTWVDYRNGDYVSIALSSSGLATIAYHEFITSSGGNLGVSYQRFQVFLPLVFKSQ